MEHSTHPELKPRLPARAAPAVRRKDTDVLLEVVGLVRASASHGAVPVVVFDLDETLVDSLERAFRIFRDIALEPEFARRFPVAAVRILHSRPSSLRSYPLYAERLLKDLGITDRAVALELEETYLDRYLSSEYCAGDRPLPDAAAYVRLIHEAGAHVVYLTGRNRPAMGEGTSAFLLRCGFPVVSDGNVSLMMKPDRAMDDTEFKAAALSDLGALGSVVAAFENEPANLNALKTAFPEGLMVFVETVHSDRPEGLLPGVHRIRDFTSPRVG